MVKKTAVIIILLGTIVLSGPAITLGQQTSGSGTYAIITWQASAYYPADFQGKALAVNGSTVDASVNVIKNQKLQDPSNATIAWYLDGNFLKQGVGLNRVSFSVTKSRGDNHSLRADIQTSDGSLSAAASVPIYSPKAVVVAPYPDSTVRSVTANLEAVPYFFNVGSFGNLSFSWIINGKEASGGTDNRLSLDLSASDNGGFPITARISNRNNPLESADGKINLIISK